jgi:hypothetical protein
MYSLAESEEAVADIAVSGRSDRKLISLFNYLICVEISKSELKVVTKSYLSSL